MRQSMRKVLRDALTEVMPAAELVSSSSSPSPLLPWFSAHVKGSATLHSRNGPCSCAHFSTMRHGDRTLTGAFASSSLRTPGPSNPTLPPSARRLLSSGETPKVDSPATTEASAPRKPGEGRDMMMLFTCGQCGTRCIKSMSRAAYERGLVIANCEGCGVKHLIADHLGWFGEKGTVEDFVKENGGKSMRITATGDFELRPEDIAGWSTTLGEGSDKQSK